MEQNGERTCKYCGKVIPDTMRSDAKYCSDLCRTNSHKKGKRGKAKPLTDSQGIKSSAKAVYQANVMDGVLVALLDIKELLTSTLELQDEFCTVDQVCELLKIGRTTFDRFVKEGVIHTYRLGGKDKRTKEGGRVVRGGKIYCKKSEIYGSMVQV